MSRTLSNIACPLLLAVAATLLAPRAAANESECILDWSDAAPIVARERLLPAPEVLTITRREFSGVPVRITLCRAGDTFIYRIVIRDNQGRLSNRTLDARTPSPSTVTSIGMADQQ